MIICHDLNGDLTLSNIRLLQAQKNRYDEFFTQIEDIDAEIAHYVEYLRDKTIFCNCNDYEETNFYRYFKDNFLRLGLKKLIATKYEITGKPSYKIEICNDLIVKKMPLKGNGDFRSDECIELLKQSDIIITNPPFSLLQEYIMQLTSFNKKFIILGNINAVTYKRVFPLIIANKLFVHKNNNKSNMSFINSSKQKIDLGGCRWFTNININLKNSFLNLCKEYIPEKYPKYDNSDIINVNKVSDIPADYDGIIGVPITFLDKYNNNQFEIVGCSTTNKLKLYINGKEFYKRLFIKKIKIKDE